MDNKDQDAQNTNDAIPQAPNPAPTGLRVIQPSRSFVQELSAKEKTAQPGINHPEATTQNVDTQSANPVLQPAYQAPAPPPLNPASIYPKEVDPLAAPSLDNSGGKKSNVIKLLVVVVLVLLIGLGGFLLINNHIKKDKLSQASTSNNGNSTLSQPVTDPDENPLNVNPQLKSEALYCDKNAVTC